MISIFPLLGMLGTVIGLLGLDLASGDMDNIKNNFFIALTSTAWGIIFSVIFKVAHACFPCRPCSSEAQSLYPYSSMCTNDGGGLNGTM